MAEVTAPIELAGVNPQENIDFDHRVVDALQRMNWRPSNLDLTNFRPGILKGVVMEKNTLVPAKLSTGAQFLSHNIVFSSSDANTVAWATGTLTMADGTTTYTIASGNTGDMEARTYIYLDADVSLTVLQKTTTAGTAVGSKKVLLAVAENDTTEAVFQVFSGIGGMLVNGEEIANLSVTSAKINDCSVAKLTAGTITSKDILLAVGTGDVAIRAGKTDFTNTESGFILGIDDSDSDRAKFYIGDATTYLNWNGLALSIAGSITATTGTIGGFTLAANTLSSGTDADYVGMSSGGTNAFWAGDSTFADAEFSVTAAGALKATSATITGTITSTAGTIGGWTLGATSLTAGTGATTTGLDSGGTNPAFYAGSATPGSAPFRVTQAGALTATSATITGAITATSGAIGGWTINSTSIADNATAALANVLIDSGNTLIRLGPTATGYITMDGANKRIRSSNYSSGVSGFTIEPDLIEAQNIVARGKLSSAVFQYNVQSAVGGELIVANADKLNADMTAADDSTLTITTDTSFAVNDILRIKDATNEEYLRVTVITSAPTYTVTRDLNDGYGAGANPAWKKGMVVTVAGSSNGVATYSGGWLRLVGEGTNSPFYEVVKRTGVAYNAFTPYARLGNLNGFLDYATDKYGFGVGESNKFITYDSTNGLRISGTSIHVRDADGNIRVSLTAGSIPYLEFWDTNQDVVGFWRGFTSGTTKVIEAVGHHQINLWATNEWNSSLTFGWKGTDPNKYLITLSPGGNVLPSTPLLGGDYQTINLGSALYPFNNLYLSGSAYLTGVQINDTSADHQYIFAVSELTTDRTVTLPLLTGNDEFVFKDFIQTLTNKTLTSPTITTPQINDTSADHQYIFAVSELTADRTVTLPLLAGNDEFVFKDFIQTLTNKTLTSPAITTPTITSPTISATWDGWVAVTDAWSYASADAPTFVITVPAGAASVYSAGMRIKLTQTTVKYFIITAASDTTLTVYGGTDYTLANAAISAISYSSAKAPQGFPLNPIKWTVKVSDVTTRSQSNPTAGTWYNLGTTTISIPIGAWEISYQVMGYIYDGNASSTNECMFKITLSTANNSESDAELTSVSKNRNTGGNTEHSVPCYRSKVLVLSSKTPYYLNMQNVEVPGTGNAISFWNANGTLVILAVCAYL